MNGSVLGAEKHAGLPVDAGHYRRFYTEWLPTAGYEQVDGGEFEMNGTKNGLNYIELWFAVREI